MNPIPFPRLRSLDPPAAPPPSRINYGAALGGPEEIAAAAFVLSSRYWACGPEVEAFEAELATWQGSSYSLFVNSGSSGLLLALATLRRNAHVAMPALQFPTAYAAAHHLGLTVSLVDIDESLNMDPKQIPAGVDAVLFVSLAGNPTNLLEVRAWCKRHDALLIEDNCEGFGGRLFKGKLGSFGDISATSFQSVHQISTGEGGAVFTNDRFLYEEMRSLRDWGRAHTRDRVRAPWYHPNYTFANLGFNFRASDLQAAVGRVQLRRLEGFTARRRENYDVLAHLLRDTPVTLPRVDGRANPSWFAFPMLCPDRDALAHALEAADIDSRPLLVGNIVRQPFAFEDGAFLYVEDVARARVRLKGDYPMAERAFIEGLWIGVHPGLTIDQLDYMASTVHRFYALGKARPGAAA